MIRVQDNVVEHTRWSLMERTNEVEGLSRAFDSSAEVYVNLKIVYLFMYSYVFVIFV